MAKEIKAGIVITAQDRTAAGIGKTRKGLDSISQGLNRIERHAKLAAGALVTVAQMRNFGAHLLRSYSELEDGLVAVAKTADLSAVEVRRLGDEINAIGQRLPVARKELLEVAAAAGQLGVKGVGNLSLFTETVGKLGLASNLSGDEAATSLARILTVTGEGIGQVDRFASAIVSLGNNFAASEREIAHHATRLATGTALYGVAAHEAAALGATLAALGLEAELGGTAVARAFASIDIALREGGEGEAAVDATAFGINLDLSEDRNVIWVLPQNMPVINTFISVSTQWHHGPSGQVIGLDYAGVRAALKALRIKTRKAFRGLQIIEAEILEGLALNK